MTAQLDSVGLANPVEVLLPGVHPSYYPVPHKMSFVSDALPLPPSSESHELHSLPTAPLMNDSNHRRGPPLPNPNTNPPWLKDGDTNKPFSMDNAVGVSFSHHVTGHVSGEEMKCDETGPEGEDVCLGQTSQFSDEGCNIAATQLSEEPHTTTTAGEPPSGNNPQRSINDVPGKGQIKRVADPYLSPSFQGSGVRRPEKTKSEGTGFPPVRSLLSFYPYPESSDSEEEEPDGSHQLNTHQPDEEELSETPSSFTTSSSSGNSMSLDSEYWPDEGDLSDLLISMHIEGVLSGPQLALALRIVVGRHGEREKAAFSKIVSRNDPVRVKLMLLAFQ